MVFSCSAFILTTRFEELHFTGFSIFSNAWLLGTMIILFCFHFPASVFRTSGSTLRQCKIATRLVVVKSKRSNWEQVRLLSKYWRSFPTIRIYFFNRNYFGKLTPLVLFKFSSRISINMMLMERRHWIWTLNWFQRCFSFNTCVNCSTCLKIKELDLCRLSSSVDYV